jgi:hypothetical protein
MNTDDTDQEESGDRDIWTSERQNPYHGLTRMTRIRKDRDIGKFAAEGVCAPQMQKSRLAAGSLLNVKKIIW